mmetsp:Transcript_12257/g.25139  ORF Transcript_12257/g.25139 Transcript_12257/m.25139 type:complete len:103 (+) Transcript_12257:915-1223(+)
MPPMERKVCSGSGLHCPFSVGEFVGVWDWEGWKEGLRVGYFNLDGGVEGKVDGKGEGKLDGMGSTQMQSRDREFHSRIGDQIGPPVCTKSLHERLGFPESGP